MIRLTDIRLYSFYKINHNNIFNIVIPVYEIRDVA